MDQKAGSGAGESAGNSGGGDAESRGGSVEDFLSDMETKLSRENDELRLQLYAANAAFKASESEAERLEDEVIQLQARHDDAQKVLAETEAKLATSETKVGHLVAQIKGKTQAIIELQNERRYL